MSRGALGGIILLTDSEQYDLVPGGGVGNKCPQTIPKGWSDPEKEVKKIHPNLNKWYPL